MPIYVYECPNCKHRLEMLTMARDPDDAPYCPSCKARPNMERVISPSTFILKGSGWAKDGYK